MTQRSRSLAALLAVLVLLSVMSAAFPVFAEDEPNTCTIQVTVEGWGSVSDGTNPPTSSKLILTPEVGETITLTATPDSGFEVLYWFNRETSRILSFTDTYTFTAGTSQYIRIVFDPDEASLAAESPPQHRVVYLTEGNNLVYSGKVAVGSTTYFSLVPSIVLYSGGRKWKGWEMTPLQVAAQTGRVFVHPTYEDTRAVVVTSIINNFATDQNPNFGTTCTLEAPATENGQPFSYWVQVPDENDPNGEEIIASPNRTYKFVAVMNVTLRAVYGADVVPEYAIRVVGDDPDYDNNQIAFYVERNAVAGCTLIETGILITRVPIGSADEMVLDSGNPDIIQRTTTSTALIGTYGRVEANWIEGGTAGSTYHFPLIFARGYMILRDRSGVIRTVYSDVYCADHTDREYSFEDNNYDDPLAGTNP